MSAFKLLIVEDYKDDLDACRSTVKRYETEKGREIKLVECKTLNNALDTIDNSFDGVIIDLKLGSEGYEGNDVIQTIHDKYRIPGAIFTGTPSNVRPNFFLFKVFTKGETSYYDIFEYLIKKYDTGLTKIFGGRGVIEKNMDKVFWNHILPQIDSWISHVERGEDTEKALLRFTINHLLEFLNDDSDSCIPEEMYITPPVSTQIKTGSIVQKKESDDYYIVLSPACDLAIHKGSIKTNRILVCLIETHNISLLRSAKKNILLEISEDDDGPIKDEKNRKIRNAKHFLTQLPQNNYSNYYHYLPQTVSFEGGIIDFRKLETYKPTEFDSKFESPIVQISMAFIKDIVARFSSYYARQGQPDFDFDFLSEDLKNCILE